MPTLPQGRLARLRERWSRTVGALLDRLPAPARRALDLLDAVRRRGEDLDLGAHGAAERLIAAIPGLEQVVRETVALLVRTRVSVGLLGLGGALWAASALGARTSETLARVFRVNASGIVRRARALAATIVLELLVVGALLARAVVEGANVPPGLRAIVGFATPLVAAAFLALVVGLSFAALAPPGIGWRDHLPGTILTTVGWLLLVTAGRFLVDRVVVRSTALYGTIGALFGLLVLIRLASSLYLYGAVTSAVLRDRRPGAAAAAG
jgi:uncharacterized BrkB/YihY/UPF0761 family membrane protein